MRKKRLFALLLCCVILLSAGPAALAIPIQPTSQTILFNGEKVTPDVYNIDGSNFFKLRDIAFLLNGSSSGFDLEFDLESYSVYAITGRTYTPVGGEMSAAVADNSDSCVRSVWKFHVDGEPVPCYCYNIGGSNYFMLRDLGDALGFEVGYDDATRTVTIGADFGEEDVFDPDFSFSTMDVYSNPWTEYDLDGYELTMINFWAYWCGPCVSEMPGIQRLSEDYDALNVISVIVDESDMDATYRVMEETGIKYPVLRYDSGFDPYQTGYIPTTIFVDRNGHVLDEPYVGSRSYEAWAEIVEGYLA